MLGEFIDLSGKGFELGGLLDLQLRHPGSVARDKVVLEEILGAHWLEDLESCLCIRIPKILVLRPEKVHMGKLFKYRCVIRACYGKGSACLGWYLVIIPGNAAVELPGLRQEQPQRFVSESLVIHDDLFPEGHFFRGCRTIRAGKKKTDQHYE